MTVAIVTTAISSFPSGWLSDRIGRKLPIMTCVFSSAFLIVLVPLQTSMNSLIIFMAAYGFATGLQGSISAWPADVSPPEKIGTAIGIYRLMADFGFFLGPIAVTYFNDYLNPSLVTAESFIIPSIVATIAGLGLIKANDPSRKTQVN
jgi:MFS family permease